MIKHQIALLLLFFVPLELSAQRCGRPDSAQNYGRVQNLSMCSALRCQHRHPAHRDYTKLFWMSGSTVE